MVLDPKFPHVIHTCRLPDFFSSWQIDLAVKRSAGDLLRARASALDMQMFSTATEHYPAHLTSQLPLVGRCSKFALGFPAFLRWCMEKA